MKKLLNILFFLALATPIFSQTVIYTKDGRTFNVPVNANEISKIEFAPTPAATTPVVTPPILASNPFTGKWARNEGGKVVEYMEISQGEKQIDWSFRESVNGAVTSKGNGQILNGEINGKGPTRNIKMKMNSQKQIEYTSFDFNGTKTWSCIWYRVN